MSDAPDEVIYCVDLDGTGSMHPASEGDDGAVEYVRADIHAERLEAMKDALGKLKWEAGGMLGAFEIELRQVMGNTNYNAVALRVQQAETALAQWGAGEDKG